MQENTATTPTNTLGSMGKDALTAKPMDPAKLTGRSSELLALEQALQVVNNPALQNKPQSVEDAMNPARAVAREKWAALSPSASAVPTTPEAALADLATPMPSDPVFAPTVPPPAPAPSPAPAPVAAPAPVSAPPPPRLIVLTGRTGAGKTFLANRIDATVLELHDPIIQMLSELWPGRKTADYYPLADTILAWGNGVQSEKYPLSIARLLFMRHILGNYPNFGNPGFWVNMLLERATETQGRVVVSNVDDPEDFRALVKAGFRHYHVVCSPNTFTSRPKRANANDGMAAALDRDVTKQLSLHRTGERLRCIWSDPAAPLPSPRLFLVDAWVAEMTRVIAETGE